MSRFPSFVLLLALCAVPLAAAVHPNTAPGFPGDQPFHAGNVDSVSLFNGSLNLTIPIGGSYPVNGGFAYNLKLVFNSHPWIFKTVQHEVAPGQFVSRVQAYPNPCSNAGIGWRVSFGRFAPPCQVSDQDNPAPPHVYQDENGTDHLFYGTLHAGDPEDAPLSGVSQILYSHDGTYLRLKVKTNGTRDLEFPDGTVRSFDSAGRLTQIQDPFNNRLNVFYNEIHPVTFQPVWRLTDSQSRTHYIVFRTDLPNYPETVDRIELTAFGTDATGAPAKAVYQFSYAVRQIGRACPHSDSDLPDSIGNDVSVPLLIGVTLPDGSSWHNTADDYVGLPAGTTCTDSSGNIKALHLPTLGRLEWTWQMLTFPQGSGGQPYVEQNPAVVTRKMLDRTPGSPLMPVLGTWTYTHAPGVPGIFTAREKTTTVTDPLGHKTVHYFSVARDVSVTGWSLRDYSLPFTRNQTLNVAPGVDLNLSRQVYNSSNTLLRSEYVLYERDPIQSSVPNPLRADNFNTNRRMLRGRTVFHDDSGSYAGVIHSDFDGVGHYRIRQTEGSFPGTNFHGRYAGYNLARGTYVIDPNTNAGSGFSVVPSSSAWVLETMAFTRNLENGAYAWVDHCFAPGTAVPVRQRIRRLDSSTPTANQSAQDLVVAYDLSTQGNVLREKFYGGDAQGGIPTGVADPCTMALPAVPERQIDHTYASGVRATSKYNTANFFLLNQTIDARTGLVSFSRDSSDIGTGYEYDTMGRLTWSKPDAGHGGWTQFLYAPASESGVTRANVTVRRRDNGSKTAPILAVDQSDFDYFGRPYQALRRLPDGSFTKSETLYDGAGNKASVSEWTTGQPAQKTSFLGYDPFGRPGTIRPPDGVTHDVTMS